MLVAKIGTTIILKKKIIDSQWNLRGFPNQDRVSSSYKHLHKRWLKFIKTEISLGYLGLFSYIRL